MNPICSTRIWGVLIATALVAIAHAGNDFAPTTTSTEMHMAEAGQRQKQFIDQFAQQARSKDTPAILAELDPATLKSAGEAAIVQVLESKVYPFFATYTTLANYERITNATLPDGRAGLWHYTYINAPDKKMLPFMIAVIDTPNGPKILDIVVDKCVKGRHPICT